MLDWGWPGTSCKRARVSERLLGFPVSCRVWSAFPYTGLGRSRHVSRPRRRGRHRRLAKEAKVWRRHHLMVMERTSAADIYANPWLAQRIRTVVYAGRYPLLLGCRWARGGASTEGGPCVCKDGQITLPFFAGGSKLQFSPPANHPPPSSGMETIELDTYPSTCMGI